MSDESPFDEMYRGYELAIIKHPSAWQVGIYPTKSDQRPLEKGRHIVVTETREAATEEAKRRVDRLLA